jgi:hypothetical protein
VRKPAIQPTRAIGASCRAGAASGHATAPQPSSGRMSELGQSRHFSRRPAASGLPQTTDIVRPPRHVGWCHFRTHAWQQTVPLLDHFVGALCSLHIERRVKPKRISETCPRRAGSTRTQLRKPLAKVRPLFGKPDRSFTSPIGYQVVRRGDASPRVLASPISHGTHNRAEVATLLGQHVLGPRGTH